MTERATMGAREAAHYLGDNRALFNRWIKEGIIQPLYFPDLKWPRFSALPGSMRNGGARYQDVHILWCPTSRET